MPSPDQLQHPFPNMPQFFERMGAAPGPDPLLVAVECLRQEIRAFRQELTPASSVILTGRDVVAEFQRLSLENVHTNRQGA